VNDEQLGLGRVKPVHWFVGGECGVGRGGRSPGGDGEFDVVGSEENDVRYTGRTVGESPNFRELATLGC